MTDKPAVTAEAEAEKLLRCKVPEHCTVVKDNGRCVWVGCHGGMRVAISAALATKDARIAALEAELSALTTPRPESEWHEDFGDVLWWQFPIEEAPYCGNPNDLGHPVELRGHEGVLSRATVGGWPGYHTHWTPITPIAKALMLSAQPGGE